MRITERTSLVAVAKAVAGALADRGIHAVLTGGACASLHSGGGITSEDVDFVLTGSVNVTDLDAAMATLGFERKANRYVHPRTRFWVEFPRGPLAIGGDLDLRPVPFDLDDPRTLALSPTDSCRDRLAAFYHWSDRQSLESAIEIALRRRLDMAKIRRWSQAEGHVERFDEFRREVAARRRRNAT